MNDNTDNAIQEAEVVSTPTDDTNSSDATVLTSLESTIKQHIRLIDQNKSELKKIREMLASALQNDETYTLHDEEAKKAAKVRAATKSELLKLTANKTFVEKSRALATEIKESDDALSEYLREYQRISGSNEFETDDGEVREIVYVAKLVRKNTR